MNPKFWLRCMLLTLILSAAVVPVLACGGGAGTPALIEDMAEKEVIVRAVVVDVDARGVNAILRVERYFKGHGGLYLTVMRQPPALEIVSRIRGYDMQCLYNGSTTPLSRDFEDGLTGYFGLRSNGNGTYSDLPAYSGPTPELYAGVSAYAAATAFWPEAGQVKFARLVDDFPVDDALDTAAFEEALRPYSDANAPVAPDASNTHYPLMRFLTMTTAAGTHYRLNPDRSITRLSGDDDPLAVSPDGSHVAFRLDANHIGFQYLSQHKSPETRKNVGPIFIQSQNGQAVMFSPDSNYAAVWDGYTLTLYQFTMPDYISRSMQMQWMGRASFHALPSAAPPALVWSANSSTIAYQDASGIWLWNIYQDAAPRLSVPAGDDTTLLDLSATGQYVRYGSQSAWTLLNAATGQTFENALAAPDESTLIMIQSNGSARQAKKPGSCMIPLAETCPVVIGFPEVITGWFWYPNQQIALLGCDPESCYLSTATWQPGIGHNFWTDAYLNILLPPLDAMAYDATYQQPVMVTDGTTLVFGFYDVIDYANQRQTRDALDVAGQVDGPIVKLEWGQPVFYEERLP